jgi:hypothetical protein
MLFCRIMDWATRDVVCRSVALLPSWGDYGAQCDAGRHPRCSSVRGSAECSRSRSARCARRLRARAIDFVVRSVACTSGCTCSYVSRFMCISNQNQIASSALGHACAVAAQTDMRRLLAHVREGRNGWWSSMEEGAASAAGSNLPLLWRGQGAVGGPVAPATPAR